MGRGLFITFEGPDGAGKTTQVDLLQRALVERGREAVFVREPGGTELGEKIRRLVLNDAAMSAEAEMFLYMAARAELLAERIRPSLDAGRTVIDDRYHDSTIAYQGGGRGAATYWPESFPRPDLTILLAVSPEAGIERMRRSGKALDRLESESLEFHRRVADAYDAMAAAEPARFLRVDADESPDGIHRRIMERVDTLLADRP